MVSTVFVLVSLWIAVLAISFEQGFPWVEESLVATASVVVLTVVHLFVLAVEFAVAVVVGETSDWGVVVDSCCLVVSGVMDAMVVFVVAGIAGSIAEVVVDCTVFAVVEWAYFYLQSERKKQHQLTSTRNSENYIKSSVKSEKKTPQKIQYKIFQIFIKLKKDQLTCSCVGAEEYCVSEWSCTQGGSSFCCGAFCNQGKLALGVPSERGLFRSWDDLCGGGGGRFCWDGGGGGARC